MFQSLIVLLAVGQVVSGYHQNICNRAKSAFAAHNLYQGNVVAWGDAEMGGDMSSVSLGVGSTNVNTADPVLCSTVGAFAARKADKTVVAWGSSSYGGNTENVTEWLTDVDRLFSTREAFAALKEDGTVVTWGSPAAGGDSSAVADMLVNIIEIASNKNTFAAVNSTGAVFLWGDYEGEAVSADCKKIYATQQAFACVMEDNTVRAFGHPDYGGVIPKYYYDNAPLEPTNVAYLYASYKCFAAVTFDGKVDSWGGKVGPRDDGCDMPASVRAELANGGVIQMQSSSNNFAALKDDGSVVFWGNSYDKSDAVPFMEVKKFLQSGVVDVFSNYNGWAALNSSGAVIVWGNGARNIDQAVLSELKSDVTYVYASAYSFAALKTGGQVVHWVNVDKNDPNNMYDTSAIATELASNVVYVITNEKALVASRTDGSTVAWGEATSGGAIPVSVKTEMANNLGPYRVYGSDHFNDPMWNGLTLTTLPSVSPTGSPVHSPTRGPTPPAGSPTVAPVTQPPQPPTLVPTELPTTSSASLVGPNQLLALVATAVAMFMF